MKAIERARERVVIERFLDVTGLRQDQHNPSAVDELLTAYCDMNGAEAAQALAVDAVVDSSDDLIPPAEEPYVDKAGNKWPQSRVQYTAALRAEDRRRTEGQLRERLPGFVMTRSRQRALTHLYGITEDEALELQRRVAEATREG